MTNRVIENTEDTEDNLSVLLGKLEKLTAEHGIPSQVKEIGYRVSEQIASAQKSLLRTILLQETHLNRLTPETLSAIKRAYKISTIMLRGTEFMEQAEARAYALNHRLSQLTY